MALVPYDGEVTPIDAPEPKAPKGLRPYDGDMEPVEPSFFDKALGKLTEIGGAITGQTGRRQRLEQAAGGVSVMEPPPSNFELQQRAEQIAERPKAPPSMTTGPANPMTFSPRPELGMESRPMDVLRAGGDVYKAGAELAGSGVAKSVAGAKRFIAATEGDNYTADYQGRQANRIDRGRDVITAGMPAGQKSLAEMVGNAGETVATALPAIALGGTNPVTRGAQLALSMGAPSAAKSYTDLRDAGLSHGMATFGGLAQGAAEAVPEAMQLSWLRGMAGKLPGVGEALQKAAAGDLSDAKKIFSYYAKGGVAEVAQEAPSTAGGWAIDAITGDPTATAGRLGKDLVEAAKSVLVQAPIQAGLMHGAAGAGKSITETVDGLANKASPSRAFAKELEAEVNGARLSQPTPQQIAAASVSRAPEAPGIPEADKPFAKRVVDQREAPASLPEQHDLYFNMGNATVMPIQNLVSTKTDEENQQGGDNGPKRMAAAAAGELSKRDPITVMPSETPGMYDVVDGNGTLTSVKKYGWQNMPVTVVPREQGLAMIEADHAKEAAKGMPIQPMRQDEGMPVSELHAALGEAGHRVASTGRLYGAPMSVVTHGDLVKFRNRLHQLAGEGTPGRFWYEESGKAVLDLAEGDRDMAEKIVGLLAIYSPSAPVSGNTTMALKAYSEYMDTGKITTVSKLGKIVADKAQQWMDGTLAEDSVTGIKRGNFYRNLMREIDPGRMGADAQGTTVDMHIARAGGYYKTKISSGVGEDSSGEYQFMDREIKRLAKELGWEPQQAQAAIWTAIKARVDAVYDAVRDDAVERGWLKKVVKTNRYGKAAISYQPATLEGGHNFEKALLDAAMAGALPDVTNYSFADAIRERTAQVSWEARPGESTGVLPGIHSAPLGQQAEYLEAIDAALRDESGQDVIAKKLGLPGSNTFFAPSAWKGVVAHGAQTETALATDRPSQSKVVAHEPAAHLLSIYSAIRGYVLNQEAVVWHYPNYTSSIKDANGIEFKMGRMPTIPEVERIYKAISDAAGHTEWAPGVTRDGLRVLNFTDTPNKVFHEIVRNALAGLPGIDGEFKRFGSVGDYIGNDWGASPNGEDYRQRIGESRRPDLQEWADGLREKVAGINAEFAKKYGWDKASPETQGLPKQALAQRGQPIRELTVEEVVPAEIIRMVNDLLAGVNIPKNQATKEEIARGEKLVAEKRRLSAEAKPMYDAMLTQIALEVDGLPMVTSLKSPESVARKLRDEYEWNPKDITDILRGTIVVSSVQEAQEAAKRIASQFPQMKRVKNRFLEPTHAGYSDVMMVIQMPNGVPAEIQITTPEMLAAKEGIGHRLYEVTRLGLLSPSKTVKADFLSKMVYASAASFRNAASEMGEPSWNALAAGYGRAPAGPKANASRLSGDKRTATHSESVGFQPSASNLSMSMGNSSNQPSVSRGRPITPVLQSALEDYAAQSEWLDGEAKAAGYASVDDMLAKDAAGFFKLAEQWREGHPATELQQAGGQFVYGPLQMSESGAGLVTQYRPKLSERDMARRGLEPLERKQAIAIDNAIGDLIAAGMPRAWAEAATFYGLKPIGLGLANYNPEDRAIGVQTPVIDRAAKGEEDARRFIRGWLAHESHHLIDNYKNSKDTMYYLSAESPRMDMRVLPNGKFVGGGDLAMEVLNVWNGITDSPAGLMEFLGYPMVQAQAMAFMGSAEDAMAFAKVELFAQLGALYTTNPGLMESALPSWFAFFEEWNNARGSAADATVERSRVALRNLFQKSVSQRADQGRGRGEGIPAGAIGQDQQRPAGTTARPGMGANAPGPGNGRGSLVLPTPSPAAKGQAALGVQNRIAKAEIPSNNHLPTHVNYSTFNSPEELKKIYAGLSQEFEKEIQTQRRGKVSNADSYRQARALIEDETGISSRKVSAMLQREPGTAAGAAEIMARMAILNAEAAATDHMAKALNEKGVLQVSEKEWIDFAAQLERMAMAHQSMLGARAEIGRAMQAIKAFAGTPFNVADMESLLATYKGKEGLAKVAEAIATTAGAGLPTGLGSGRANALGRLAKAAANPTKLEAMIELWKAFLLSGPVTQLTNLVGNAAYGLMRIPEAAIAGTVGAIHGGKRAHLGDTIGLAMGMYLGTLQGARAAWQVIKDEDAVIGPTPAEDRQHAIAGATFGATGNAGAAIDYLGKAVRVPFRGLGATDAFFKMIHMYGSLYQLATNRALEEGGYSAGFSRRVAELIKEGERVMLDPEGVMGPMPTSPEGKAIGLQAIKDGLTWTFNNRLSEGVRFPIGSSIELLRNRVAPLHFVIPFVRTPTNIFRQTLERTPLAPLSGQWRNDFKAGGQSRDLAMSKVILGTALSGLVFHLVSQGLMTGGGDPEKDARRRKAEAGILPYSIKLFGKWYEYRRIEPLGTLLGAAADAFEVNQYRQQENAEHVWTAVGAAFAQAVTNKTYMRALSDLVNVASDPERYGENWIQGYAGSVVPAAVSQYARAQDVDEQGRPITRSSQSSGEGMSGTKDAINTLKLAVQSRLPKTPLNPEFNRQSLPVKYDTWGDQKSGGTPTFPGSPIRASEPSQDPVRTEALRLNVRGNTEPMAVGGVRLNPDQRSRASFEAGSAAHQIMSSIVGGEFYQGLSDGGKRIVFKEVMDAGREYGRGIITPEVMDAMVEKIMKGLADVEHD